MTPLVAEVHGSLRRWLLDGRFPVWERLAEVRLAEMLEVSRTPVREALRRLEREELVQAEPGGGYRPRVPDLDHLRDLYEVRMRLEDLAVERAVEREADLGKLKGLHEEWERLSQDPEVMEGEGEADFVYREEPFHLGIAQAGGNGALVTMLQGVNDRIRIVRVQDFLVPGRIGATVNEHLGIIEAILARDLEDARERMRLHIMKSASLVDDRTMRAIARMVRRPDNQR
jgi:DNA-binding GntR family transcriptional regulator